MKLQEQINMKIIGAVVMLMAAITSGCDDSNDLSNSLPLLPFGTTQSSVTFNSLDADEQAYPEIIAVTLPSKTVEALPTEPVKSGMVFAGWTTEPNGGVLFTADMRVTENLTVYSTWATPGLKFTLINGGKEYSVQKGSANTSGTVVIPGYWSGKKVTAVGAYGFSHCTTMTIVTIPDHVTSIGENAFYGCNGLTGVTLPGSLAYIGQAAFYSCTGLTGIAIPDSVIEIGPGAFAYCSGLASLTFALQGRLTTIGEYAFGFCTNLTQTTLPDSITSIEHRSFYSCTSLMEITINSMTPPETCICLFFNCPMLQHIKVPAGSVEVYQSTYGWNSYADDIISL